MELNDALDVLWPGRGDEDARVRAVWSGQGFAFFEDSLCILQHINGPCGPLAVVNAHVLASALREEKDVEGRFGDERIGWVVDAVSRILWRCAERRGVEKVYLVRVDRGDVEEGQNWVRRVLGKEEGVVAGDVEGKMEECGVDRLVVEEVEGKDEVLRGVRAMVEEWFEDGVGICGGNQDEGTLSPSFPSKHPAVVLLCLAAILTRGVAVVRKQLRESSSEDLSSFIGADGNGELALVTLLLTGEAIGGVEDHHWSGYWTRGEKEDGDGEGGGEEGVSLSSSSSSSSASSTSTSHHLSSSSSFDIGFLTNSPGYTPCGFLRDANLEAWVVLSGMHLTCVCHNKFHPSCLPSPAPDTKRMVVFNGMKPRFARECPVHIAPFLLHTGEGEDGGGGGGGGGGGEEEGGGLKGRFLLRRREWGTVEEKEKDLEKGGDGYWWEVVCDPAGELEKHEEGDRPPYEGRWYCRDCFLKHGFTAEGFNAEDAPVCSSCRQPPHLCGWAHHLSAVDIPIAKRREWERERAPAPLQIFLPMFPKANATWIFKPTSATTPKPPRLGV